MNTKEKLAKAKKDLAVAKSSMRKRDLIKYIRRLEKEFKYDKN